MIFIKNNILFDAVRKISSLFFNKHQSTTVDHPNLNSVHPSKLKINSCKFVTN